MPIIAPPTGKHFSRPEEVIEFWLDKFQQNSEPLGLAYVAAYNEDLIPAYPAIAINHAGMDKELHATHTFQLTHRVDFFVMHAKATEDYKKRSLSDLLLATGVKNFVEQDKKLVDVDHPNGKVIFSFIESEVPGLIAPGGLKSNLVVSTRMSWFAISQIRF